MEGSGVKVKMLKRSGSRNQRSISLKVKHALWILVLLAICIWFLYQSQNKNGGALERRLAQVSGNDEYQLLKMGRKELRRRADEVAAEGQKDGEEEVGVEDGESREREADEEVGVDRDEEMDAGDKEKSEEAEHDQLLELIDEDDKDR
ncbi:hypothetical protein Sango_2370400 [Sesamum angolense]|uniref:Uncharacterized protein n=1 Tax=Sesamum angolense TaxID=2727404 RepID=A0AAE1W6B9_9LAMI|nr:hypothetical protein Sango_2370400 [Sesamum angolense]